MFTRAKRHHAAVKAAEVGPELTEEKSEAIKSKTLPFSPLRAMY